MNRRILLVATLVVLVPLAFVVGRWTSRRPPAKAGGRQVLYYVDPMNPAFRSPEPGVAPCGMPLEPVYADGPGAAGSAAASGIAVPADRRQLIGVKTEVVARRPVEHALRLLGRVAPDERRVHRINTVTIGWVRELSGATTGSIVSKDELLGRYYSQEIIGPQQAFIYALGALDRFRESGANEEQIEINDRNVESAQQTLLNLGMTDAQVAEIARTRQVARLTEIRAPAAGFVLARNVTVGQRFDPVTDLFVIADLSRVWILADAFETDAEYFQPGAAAKVTLPALGKSFAATVSRILPQFDPSTRTLKVRLEADNPGFALRPDMFVDVELPVALPPTIVVPVSAVLDSGARKTVFVEQSEGIFAPRRVETGRRFGGGVEIISGLMDGEKIVVSGNFLLDSESRMRTASAVDSAAPSPAAAPASGVSIDPVCGMQVNEAEARAAGRVSEHAGRTIYFCNPGCKQRFDENPAAFLAQAGPASGAATPPADQSGEHRHD